MTLVDSWSNWRNKQVVDWSQNTWCAYEEVKWSEVAQSCPTLCNPVAHQAPPSMGFSRQEYWSGLPFPSPGIFPTQGSNLRHLHLLYRQVDSLPLSHLGGQCGANSRFAFENFLENFFLKYFKKSWNIYLGVPVLAVAHVIFSLACGILVVSWGLLDFPTLIRMKHFW